MRHLMNAGRWARHLQKQADMSDKFIVEHCSPTLAGIKTGNLFSVRMQADTNLNKELIRLNKLLHEKGLCAIPIKKTDEYALIYLYRPDHLGRDLSNPEAVKILNEKGYTCGNINKCIARLISQLSIQGDFPHEIGLFLGYPPEDVKGFMNDPSKGVKCTGFWKVYGNEKRARELFGEYKRCTRSYKAELEKGKTLYELVVPRQA